MPYNFLNPDSCNYAKLTTLLRVMPLSSANFVNRRSVLGTLSKLLGTSVLLTITGTEQVFALPYSRKTFTVGQIIDLILKEIPGAPFAQTVDALKTGNLNQTVTGIVSTTFPTEEVIRKAIALNANFLIVHEPSFYNHLDDTKWLENDGVFRYKYELLTKHNIAVWRFHDYWHAHRPDGIQTGVLKTLGWDKYADTQNLRIVNLPATPLKSVIAHVKQKMGITTLRYVGDSAQSCQRVLLLPGAWGGKNQIEAISREKPDLVICGEVSEWETPEYVRDARSKGEKLSLIVLGHQPSEEPGMEYLVTWLQPKVPNLTVTHVPARNAFVWQ